MTLTGTRAKHDVSEAKVHDEVAWPGRPLLARLVRALVLLGPLLVSLAVTATVTRAFPTPAGTGPRIAWWAALLLLATGTVWATDRVLRRLMPLAALLEMSVLFPGRAPSRFSVARQTGTTRQLEELVERARASDENTEPVVAASRILALVGALRSHDRATRGHSERVRVLTDLVAEELGLSQPERDRLRWAALLHDIGKLDVPAEILNKPGQPTAQEWERLRQHPEAGAKLAAPLLDWLGASAPVIVQHHERWDGLGYPAGLAGAQICVGARIVAVADAFEVMTAARSYKKAMTRAEALREMTKMSGTQFDPAAVRALLSISAPRLRGAIGPWAWVAQLPVIGTAPSLAGAAASVASQTAAGVGAVGLGTAVGITTVTPITPIDLPIAVESPRVVQPVGPQAATPAASATRSPVDIGRTSTQSGQELLVRSEPLPSSATTASPARPAPLPVAQPAPSPTLTAQTSTVATASPSPTATASRRGTRPTTAATQVAGPARSQEPEPSLTPSPTASPTPTKESKQRPAGR